MDANLINPSARAFYLNPSSTQVGTLRELMSPLIYTVDANAFELFSRADGRLRVLDRMLSPSEMTLANKVSVQLGRGRGLECFAFLVK